MDGPAAGGGEQGAKAAGGGGEEPNFRPDDPVSSVYVSFKGLKRVSPHSLIGECRALGHVRRLGDLHYALQDADARLRELGLFKEMRADVSVEPGGAVEVAFVATERGRELTVSGNVDKKGEVSADIRAVQPAVFGGPLCAAGSVGSTASQAREFVARLSTPRFLGRRLNWSFDVARSSTDESQASSYSESVSHAFMKLTDDSGRHTLSMEAALRDLFPCTARHRAPSLEVQQSRLRSIKTSVAYSFSQSWADPSSPSSALGLGAGPCARLRADLEAAAAPGDARFLRGEAQASATCPLPWNLLWHVSGACGWLLPTDRQPTCLQDRFFLGGASGSSSIFKGFRHRGLGPMGACRLRSPASSEGPGACDQDGLDAAPAPEQRVDALGGDVMLNAFTAVSAPLRLPEGAPGRDAGARVFAFAGLGALALTPTCAGCPSAYADSLRRGARASVGAGLSVPLAGMGGLELTFSQPLWAHKQDLTQRWQVGIRLSLGG